MEEYKKLRETILECEDDFVKFYGKGNKAAGTRIRKDMQIIKTIAQAIRKQVQESKNEDC